MALTEQQDILQKPVVKEPWTMRRLFPFLGTASAFAKVFANPFDMMLGFLVLVFGLTELLGREVSWMFLAFSVLVLAANIYERRKSPEPVGKPEVKKEESK